MTPIDQIVRQLCIQTGEPDYKNYDKILISVRSALADLSIHTMPAVKTVELKANTLGNLSWPCDCLKPLLIGLLRNGKACNLSVDDRIGSSSTCGCSSVTEVENHIDSYVLSEEYGTDIFYQDEFGNKIYGAGYDGVGICSHDKLNKITHLKCKVMANDKFSFTYLADGISEGVTHVPVESERAIKEFVLFDYYRIANLGISDRAYDRYKEESYRLEGFYLNTTREDWIKAVVKP